jgi:hypothetical protein
LAFDIYFAESGGTQSLEHGGGVTDLHSMVYAVFLVGLLFEAVLGAMGFEKFTTRLIVVEAKLISEEA